MIKTIVRPLFICLSLFIFSAQSATTEKLEAQRKLFLKAESAAKSGQVKTYKKLVKALGDYPLVPYVELAYLSRYPYLSNKDEIRRFLTIYEGTPLEWPLRIKWLRYIAKKNKPLLYINDYKESSIADLNCQYVLSEIAIGAKLKDVSQSISKLWQVGKSQPKACDPLFKKWIKAGFLSQDIIKQRIKLAADGGSHSLIPYLTKKLKTDKDKRWAKRWHATRRNPTYIKNIHLFDKNAQADVEIQFYGLKRLIWRDPEAALNHWQKYAKKLKLNEEQQGELSYTFALALASKQHKKAEDWLARVPKVKINSQIAHWHLATYLRQSDWQGVVNLINRLPENIASESIYRYWLARGNNALGLKTLEQGLNQLALSRHYYGFLAAARLKQSPQLEHEGYPVDDAMVTYIKSSPSAKRAFELLELNRKTEARREWNKFRLTLNNDEQAAAAYVASQWQWYDQALRGISKAGYFNDTDIRFPVAYEPLFNKYSARAKIEPTLAFAISRRESSFMNDAYSPVGALGLMQIMPNTAKMLNGRRMSKHQLFDAKTNIRLGTKYIGQLIERMSGQIPLAIASYNAGYSRVKRWIPKEAQPLDIWIETIPYKETREYVKAVLAYQQVYELKKENPAQIFERVVKQSIYR